jgi:hypothetical protein
MCIKIGLLSIILIQAFPKEPGSNGPDITDKKHPLIAGVETLFTDALFIGITGLILDYPWAHSTTETIRENFSHPPIWEDTDGFKVNQIGHPWASANDMITTTIAGGPSRRNTAPALS